MAEKTSIESELRVKEILKERGIKMKDLADLIQVAPETMTRALKGNPQFSTLKSIADVLGVSVRELFKGEDAKPSENQVHGCIYIDHKPHIFNNREELDKLLNKE